MENLVNDTRKFEKRNLNSDGILNFAVNQGKCVDNILKKKLYASKSISEKNNEIS